MGLLYFYFIKKEEEEEEEGRQNGREQPHDYVTYNKRCDAPIGYTGCPVIVATFFALHISKCIILAVPFVFPF